MAIVGLNNSAEPGELVTLSGPKASYDGTPINTPGAGSIKLDMTGNKQQGEATIFPGQPFAPTGEWMIVFQMQIDGSYVVSYVEHPFLRGAANTYQVIAKKSGSSLPTFKLVWNGTEIDAASAFTGPALGRATKYRVGLYVKFGTAGVADSTMKLYVDDITTSDVVIGAGTLRQSSTTVNMAAQPSPIGAILGNTSGSTSGWGLIYYFQHIVGMDTTGSCSSGADAPASRVRDPWYVTATAYPIGAGNYAEQTSGTFADVDEVSPNTTDYCQFNIALGAAAKKATFTMTQWATIGLGSTDTPYAVQGRINHNTTPTGGLAAFGAAMIREGGTDSICGGTSSANAWVYHPSGGSAPANNLLRQVPPGSGGSWSVTLVNGVEIGGQYDDFSAAGDPRLSWVGMWAAFVKGAPATSLVPRRKSAKRIIRGERRKVAA